MAGISSAVEVTDRMTPIITNITNALNIMLGAMERTQTATDSGFDASVISGAREEIYGAESALVQYREEMERLRNNRLPTPDMPDMPVWQPSNMPVFTNSGADRFQAEINAANASMRDMLQTQATISQKAQNMRVMPPGMMNDMAGIHNRMRQMQTRIQEINRIPLNMRTDTVNNELETLRGQLSQARTAQDGLNAAMSSMDIGNINAEYQKLCNVMGTAERQLRDNVKVQKQFTGEVKQGENAFSSLKQVAAALGVGLGIKFLTGMSDTITQTSARLDMMNYGLQTTEELQQMIFNSAQDSRASYTATADAVAKLGNNARDAFTNNTELVRFSELVNKQFTIAGTSSQEAANAFLQLTQAMGSGVLRGDELNSIFEQAPNLIQTIADYMGVSIGEIRDLASEGAITADIIKNAMFAAGDEIDEKFNDMPMTWGQVMTKFANDAIIQLQPLLDRINELANDESIQSLISNVGELLGFAASAGVEIIDLLAGILDTVRPFVPFFFAAGAAIGIVVMVTKLWAITQALVTAAMTPMGVMVFVIIGIVAAIYFLVDAVNDLTGSTLSATGIIMGAFAVMGANINNYITYVWNAVAAFINFFANVFKDPIASIKILFMDMALNVIGYIQQIASAIEALINKIPGVEVDITAGLDNFYNAVADASQKVKDESAWEEVVKKKEFISYESAWDNGYNFGEGIDKAFSGFSAGNILDKLAKNASDGLMGNDNSDLLSNVNNIANDTSDITDAMDITQEELKYMNDIAEQDAINRFTTAEIKVDLGGVTNQVNNNNDLDGMVDYLAARIEETMVVMAEGVH